MACALAAGAAAWLMALNVLAGSAVIPYVLHGRSVDVVVSTCGGATCRGDYRITTGTFAGRSFAGRDLLGVRSARAGSVKRATVDGSHPGAATAANPALTLTEAVLLALIGLALFALCVRGGVRAWRRRDGSEGPPDQSAFEGPADQRGVVASVDDPLAWVRRRRFGAGG